MGPYTTYSHFLLHRNHNFLWFQCSDIGKLIPFSFSSTKTNKRWFNSACACSRAIRHRDAAFRNYHRLQSSETKIFIFHQGIEQNLFSVTKNSFLSRKCNNFLVPLNHPFSGILQKKKKKSTLTLRLTLSLLLYLLNTILLS